MLELHGVGQPHAYETYRRRILYSSILPIEIGDFVTKDESAERSLGLSGVYLPPRKGQNVPKDGTKLHIILISAKKKWKNVPRKAIFCPKTFLRVVFPKHENVPIWHQNHKQASIAEESGWGFSTGIYLFFRDAMGVGKIM